LAEKRKTIYVIQGSQSSVYEVITTFLTALMMEAAGSTEWDVLCQPDNMSLHPVTHYHKKWQLQTESYITSAIICVHTGNKGRSLILDHKYILLQLN